VPDRQTDRQAEGWTLKETDPHPKAVDSQTDGWTLRDRPAPKSCGPNDLHGEVAADTPDLDLRPACRWLGEEGHHAERRAIHLAKVGFEAAEREKRLPRRPQIPPLAVPSRHSSTCYTRAPLAVDPYHWLPNRDQMSCSSCQLNCPAAQPDGRGAAFPAHHQRPRRAGPLGF
jgi:hypothetical protein